MNKEITIIDLLNKIMEIVSIKRLTIDDLIIERV